MVDGWVLPCRHPARRRAAVLCELCRRVVHHALDVLKRGRRDLEARVPLRVSGDAGVHSPRHMNIARITLDNCVAFSLNGHVCIARVAARLVRAIRHVGVDRERTLKVLE